jgi:hypothetical protein
MNAKVRAWWSSRQGLDGSLRGSTPSEALLQSGWSRSVGGASPYITLFARTGASRADIDHAVATSKILELPSARGCTYILPDDHFGLGLTVSEGFGSESAFAQAKKFLGVTNAEIENLSEAVVKAVTTTPLDPKEIKGVVGDLARSLGDEGKKRGTGSTLPLALGLLQTAGRIRRVSIDGRLDRQRYKYVAWNPNPVTAYGRPKEQALVELARLWWKWAGPATVSHFQWFTATSGKAAREVTSGLGLVTAVEGTELLILPEGLLAFKAFEPPAAPTFNLVASLDAHMLHRRDIRSLVDEADHGRETVTEKTAVPITSVQDLYSNAILDRGRIVGLWEFDPADGRIVWVSWVGKPQELVDEVEKTEAFVREQLGDCRSFSLDSPESRVPKLRILREMASQ